MIRVENGLKTSLQDVLKKSWRSLEDVFTRHLEDVLKTFWRRLENVLKTSWKRLEDVWSRRIYWSSPRRLEDVLKTSSEDVWLRRIYSSWSRRLENVFWRQRQKTSSSRRMFAGNKHVTYQRRRMNVHKQWNNHSTMKWNL